MCQLNNINVFVPSDKALLTHQSCMARKIITLEVTAIQVAVFVLGLLNIIPILLASSDQFYIRPSEEAPCPSEPCYLLSHVLNSMEHLTSNTVVTLTPGNYFINESVRANIDNVHNLTLMGSNTGNTVVNCSKEFFLLVTHVNRSCHLKPQLLQLHNVIHTSRSNTSNTNSASKGLDCDFD